VTRHGLRQVICAPYLPTGILHIVFGFLPGLLVFVRLPLPRPVRQRLYHNIGGKKNGQHPRPIRRTRLEFATTQCTTKQATRLYDASDTL